MMNKYGPIPDPYWLLMPQPFNVTEIRQTDRPIWTTCH